MKLIESCLLEPEIIRLVPVNDVDYSKGDWEKGAEASLIVHQEDVFLSQDNLLIPVDIVDHEEKVKSMIAQRNTFWVITSLTPTDIYLQKCTVAARVPNNFQVGVDEWVAEQLYKAQLIISESVDQALAWLADEFILDHGGNDLVFSAIPARRSDDSIVIIGREWLGTIEIDGENATRLKNIHRSGRDFESVGVLEGNIAFADCSAASVVNDSETKRKFEEVLRSHGSYIELWEDYSNTDWEIVVEQARTIGFIQYNRVSAVGEESILWEFNVDNPEVLKTFLDSFDDLDSRDFQLESSSSKPDWLDNDKPVSQSGFESSPDRVGGELIQRSESSITLKLDDQRKQDRPVVQGYLYLSLSGHIVNRVRRQKAQTQIQTGNNPMPQLHRLLEGYAMGSRRRQKLPALTPYAKQAFNGGKPTPKQEKAIDIALNTPDIAIIVGPPGTGKTQVITALQRRLAEVAGNLELNHQTLISSFQHDAVDNVIARSDVFGLPAIKVGARGGRKSDSSIDRVEEWCQKKYQDVQSQLKDFLEKTPFLTTLEDLASEVSTLFYTPMLPEERQEKFEKTSELLQKLHRESSIRMPASIQSEWELWVEEHGSDLNYKKMSADKLLLRRLRALRTTAGSFADDGPEQAWRLLDQSYRYPSLLNDDAKDLLSIISEAFNGATEEQLRQLEELKDNLLDKIRPDYRPPALKSLIDEQGCRLLNELLKAINEKIKSSQLGEYAVLKSYQQSLLNEPCRIREATSKYTNILAATCQQSASSHMTALKNVEYQDQISFENVIIDEAARANPMDLFVPMAMASRRIVLVGDHRQLPHMLEPEVEKAMSVRDELDEHRQDMLKESLFERLLKQMRDLEKQDGYPRVIMLDTQFRMHPILGDFVSRNFYENQNEDKILSVRDSADFYHGIHEFKDKVCAWIDIPKNDGNWRRRKGGSSRYRPIEAREIAVRAKKMMEDYPSISFGVITFYSAQRDEILDQFCQLGVAEKVQGNYRIRKQWASLPDGKERLRVGSVDAFQGKEFDVVFLSTVLTACEPLKDVNDVREERRKYGFLTLDNRVNVAMSRQKKLLICVGDSSFFRTEEACDVVPTMNAFYELCGGEHGKIVH